MKAIIWLSYDLGVRGDYEGLYAWLDDRKAKECGDSVAYLEFEYKLDFLAELRRSLQKAFVNSAKARIYVIHSVGKQSGAKGQWVIGGRKSPPWTGFGSSGREEVDQ